MTIPIDVISCGRSVRTCLIPSASYCNPVDPPSSFMSTLAALQGFERRLLLNLQFHVSINDLLVDLRSGSVTVLAATDGGSKRHTASFG